MDIAVVVGNPKPGSRTLAVATAVADLLAPDRADRLTVDLAALGPAVLDRDATHVSDLQARVAASDLIIVASPTYKATYTGLLKVFLDRYGNDGLAGTVAVGVMTGAGRDHALAPEVHLRPLLVELGASLPTRSVYVTEDQLADLDAALAPWAVTAVDQVRRALAAGRPG